MRQIKVEDLNRNEELANKLNACKVLGKMKDILDKNIFKEVSERFEIEIRVLKRAYKNFINFGYVDGRNKDNKKAYYILNFKDNEEITDEAILEKLNIAEARKETNKQKTAQREAREAREDTNKKGNKELSNYIKKKITKLKYLEHKSDNEISEMLNVKRRAVRKVLENFKFNCTTNHIGDIVAINQQVNTEKYTRKFKMVSKIGINRATAQFNSVIASL